MSCLPIISSLENREVSDFAALPPPFTEAWPGFITWLLLVWGDVGNVPVRNSGRKKKFARSKCFRSNISGSLG